MARKLRTEYEWAIHHVTIRGNRRESIFVDDEDRMLFIRLLDAAIKRSRWNCLSYCLMPNHVHLVIETPERTLAKGMQWLAGVYAQRFNRRHRHTGHLFQGRYGNSLVETDIYLALVLRYVAMNPVKADLCADPREWRWSSHAALLVPSGGRPAIAHARERFDSLLDVVGGEPGDRYSRLFDETGPLPEALDALAERPSLEAIFSGASQNDAMHVARRHGYTLKEIGALLGVHESTVSRRLRRCPAPPEESIHLGAIVDPECSSSVGTAGAVAPQQLPSRQVARRPSPSTPVTASDSSPRTRGPNAARRTRTRPPP